jgi:hypothetical protein
MEKINLVDGALVVIPMKDYNELMELKNNIDDLLKKEKSLLYLESKTVGLGGLYGQTYKIVTNEKLKQIYETKIQILQEHVDYWQKSFITIEKQIAELKEKRKKRWYHLF